MDHEILRKYAEKIPFEVKSILHGLDDDNRLGIIVALLENDKMTFNEMKEKFQMNSSSLSNHLSILQEGNLVQNFYEKNNKRVSSYYDVTDIPESMLHAILDVSFNNSEKKYDEYKDEIKIKNIESITQSIKYDKLSPIRIEFKEQKLRAT